MQWKMTLSVSRELSSLVAVVPGNNTVNRIHHMGVSGAETIAINTDKQHLDMIQADKRILIGKSLTKGLGAGGYPDVGKRAAEMARPTLEAILESADLVFITAGMGGGTGTGSAPVVASDCKGAGRNRCRNGQLSVPGRKSAPDPCRRRS
jgi:cell division GTPase FtsZ